MPQRVTSVIYGAAGGAFLAIVGLTVFGSRASLKSVQGVLLDPAAGRGRSDFVVSSGGLYLAVIILAILGGLVVAGAIYAFGSRDAGERRFPLRFLLPTAGITAAIMTYAVLRAGLGAVATIELGSVTVSVFRLIVVSLVAGAVAGGATASVVDALARPSFLGFEGEAAPHSPAAFMREMVSAVGAPTIAVVASAVFAIGLSQILLSLHGAAAVAAFAVVGAAVLGGAALVAYRPWDKTSTKY